MKIINGGVCAAKGFTASGVHCGIRKNRTKKDLALIYSEQRATAAAVYTTNLVKGAPLTVTKENISDGIAQAIICNSGNANTCNANGIEIAKETCKFVATIEDSKVEMGRNKYGFHSGVTQDSEGLQLNLGSCRPFDQSSTLHPCKYYLFRCKTSRVIHRQDCLLAWCA